MTLKSLLKFTHMFLIELDSCMRLLHCPSNGPIEGPHSNEVRPEDLVPKIQRKPIVQDHLLDSLSYGLVNSPWGGANENLPQR